MDNDKDIEKVGMLVIENFIKNYFTGIYTNIYLDAVNLLIEVNKQEIIDELTNLLSFADNMELDEVRSNFINLITDKMDREIDLLDIELNEEKVSLVKSYYLLRFLNDFHNIEPDIKQDIVTRLNEAEDMISELCVILTNYNDVNYIDWFIFISDLGKNFKIFINANNEVEDSDTTDDYNEKLVKLTRLRDTIENSELRDLLILENIDVDFEILFNKYYNKDLEISYIINMTKVLLLLSLQEEEFTSDPTGFLEDKLIDIENRDKIVRTIISESV